MGKFLFALPMALVLAQGAWGACGDTTFTITGNPYNPSALITHIQNCEDSSVVLTLKNGMGTGLDTVRLTTRILVSGRPGGNSVVTHIRGEGRTAGSPLIVTENPATAPATTDPLLFDFQAGNRGILSNIHVVRKVSNNSGHSVAIAAKGTVIRDCHFYRTDNTSQQTTGALLYVTADSVLVERNLFRAPPNGKGRTIAIYANTGANRNEYRSNIFYSTGVYLVGGTFHIFANTFAGSRDDYNAIIVSSSLTTSNTVDRAVNIQHNLFALKADTLAPILYGSTTLATADSIQKNAWSRSRPTLPLAVNGANAAVTLANTVGGNANVVLPKGFSRYGPHVTQFKEYPLVTMRADESLPRGSSDFGVIPRVYSNSVSTWTSIPDIEAGLPSGKLFFPNNSSTVFTPFFSGKSWASSAGIKVGALVDIETRLTPPSPLDSGIVNRSFNVTRNPADSTRAKVSLIDFDPTFYDTLIPPGDMWFFFHNTLGRLAANDSAGLKNPATGTPYHYKRDWLSFDSVLTVPKEVRTGNTIYVKMLHYNAGGQATVLSSGVIAQLTGIPAFPINDLGVPTVDASSVPASGNFVIKVLKAGSETIDSIRVDVQRVGGGVESSRTVAAPAQNASATINFTLPRGSFQFTATPIAIVGSALQSGPATAPSGVHISRGSAGDTVLVINRADTTGCGNQSGASDATAFCTLDDALAELASKGGGGTILVKNGTPAVPFQGITISDTNASSVIITVPTLNGAFDPNHRAAFRGTASKEALAIARKNVTLRGFLIEMPAASTVPALDVKSSATGVNVDGCVFRSTTNAAAGGPAINIATSGNGDMRFVNNLVWGFGAGVRINSTSDNVRILHNTFIEEASHNSPMTAVLIPAAASGAVIANNYFSGLSAPYDASVAGKDITLDHNGYPSNSPQLRGHSEKGAIDSIPRLPALDLSLSTWRDAFRTAMETVTNCDAVTECYELYAGSSAESYGPAITGDVLGRPRLGKPEVGAFEAEPTSTGVRGVLMLNVRSLANGTAGADNRLVYTVTPGIYDPADPESVYVWWSTRSNPALTDSIPAGSQARFPVAALNSGAYTDTAVGLNSNQTYHVAAAFGRNPTKSPGGRILGYPYRDRATTAITIDTNDCVLRIENPPVCPQQGYFSAPLAGDYRTRVELQQRDSGVVKVPVLYTPTNRLFAGGKIEITPVLPVIRLSVTAGRLGQPGSKQNWKASIRTTPDPSSILDFNELFILPEDPDGLPTFVPTWRLREDGADWVIEIEGTESGTFDYAFGKMTVGAEAGKVAVDESSVPLFSYKTVRSGDSASVSLKFSGTGFATSNPLILVTPVPAGGIYPNPMRNQYPNRTLMLTSGLSGLDDSLRLERFHRYYEAAVAVDSSLELSPAAPGTRKPFVLTSTTLAAMEGKSLLPASDLQVSDAGNLLETTLRVPIWRAHAETKSYDNDTGRMTRSIEAIFTVFDGAKISRASGFIRTEFADTLHYSEVAEFRSHVWNLHAYPWEEGDDDNLARIMERTDWNKDELRLMKYKGAGSGASAYTMYEGGDAAGIEYDAGRAVWTGAIDYYQPRTSDGRSLDYRPFRLGLNAGVWNDIGLPFNFPMKWADVLRASNLNPATFQVYRYRPATDTSPGTWGLPLTASDVVHPWQGLTVKPAAGDTVLVFPVLDSSRSATPLAKRAADGRWSARIRAYNTTASMSLRIGKGASENLTGEAPDIPGQDFRVGLRRMGRDGVESLAEHIQAGEDWRGHWPISGRAAKAGIRLAVEENRKKTPLYLVELLSRKSTPLTGGAEVSLSAEELQNGDYHLVAGDSRYLEEVLDGLVPMHLLDLANYPNPFSHSTLIRYALPESYGKVEFRLKIRDSRGRQVWEGTFRGSNSLSHQWDGRDSRGKAVGAGFYTLSLEAVAPGKGTQRAVRRILKF